MSNLDNINNKMLATSSSNSKSSYNSSNNLIPCWPALEAALERLLPLNYESETTEVLVSEDYLKLYTLVFDYCVGNSSLNEKSTDKKPNNSSAFMFGEDLYYAIESFLSKRFVDWSKFIELKSKEELFPDSLLKQFTTIQTAEKPLIFIFTYLERHWIDRQIREHRREVFPIKQLLWTKWERIVYVSIENKMRENLREILNISRENLVELDELKNLSKFVHFLKVISKPELVESDYEKTIKRKVGSKGTNGGGIKSAANTTTTDRFKEFVVEIYCEGIKLWCDSHKILQSFGNTTMNNFTIKSALQFWNDEEGRMAFLRFDKSSVIFVRNYMKEHLLLPNMEMIKKIFKSCIISWNTLEANEIYRLLANRKSLLSVLDTEAYEAFLLKGHDFINTNMNVNTSNAANDNLFITLIGQYYNMTTELIQTSFASRPEIFDARSRAFRNLFNSPQIITSSCPISPAKSLAQCTDFVVSNFSVTEAEFDENLKVIMALFRILEDKSEYQEFYTKLLSVRLLNLYSILNSSNSNITNNTNNNNSNSTIQSHDQKLFACLREICGANFISQYERIYTDFNGHTSSKNSSQINPLIITGGTWNIKGKILSGHPLLLNANSNNITTNFNWPTSIEQFQLAYQTDFPKRKLFWSPALSSIEFDYYSLNGHHKLTIKANCIQYELMKHLSFDSWTNLDGVASVKNSLQDWILVPMLNSGLIFRDKNASNSFILNKEIFNITHEMIDVYGSSINMYENSNFVNLSSASNNSGNGLHTPSTSSFTPKLKLNKSISTGSKSILLQCSITKTLKQLRTLSLSDLYNHISMLPNILKRFSPTMDEILEALKQLHEKEFIQLRFGDIDYSNALEEDDLKTLSEYHENLLIKYVA